MLGLTRRELETCPRVPDCGPARKRRNEPPAPTGGAPAPDPTGRTVWSTTTKRKGVPSSDHSSAAEGSSGARRNRGDEQPLDEDVVQAPPAAVHRALRARRQHPLGERRARKLRPLIRVEDLRRARPKRRFQRLDAEAGVHRVRQPPSQHVTAGPVHDRDQVQEARRHRDVGDVGAPDLVRAVYRQLSKQIRIDAVTRLRGARTRLAVERFQPHQTHQPADPAPSHQRALAPQVARHLPAAVERVLQRQFVHPAHQGQVRRALFPRRVVHRRAVDAQQRALAPDTQRAVPLDQLQACGAAQRCKPRTMRSSGLCGVG